ncbi:MAG: hypothetical protein QNJ38_17960 [Prochloraceae cyanobacterium]|nr:hypothetical protein [Prochloraceae cyanobacterium]
MLNAIDKKKVNLNKFDFKKIENYLWLRSLYDSLPLMSKEGSHRTQSRLEHEF